MPLRKQYVLINSDDRTAASRSTTDFNVVLREPINNVVKTDLVAVSMDYNMANITAPNNTFQIKTYGELSKGVDASPSVLGEVTEDYAIDEDQYTAAELRAYLEELLGGQDGYYDVMLVNRNLRIEYWFPETRTTPDERVFKFICSNATLKTSLGMTGNTLTGTYVSTIGEFGGSRINFPRAIRLPSTSPFIMIQSAELGIRTKTSSGLGFWRALINDPSTDTLQAANSRTDDYLDEPKRLQDIDIRLGFPNGARVDNRGAAFSILIEIVTNEEEKRSTE
jgi:hypothetical protein